MKKKYNFLVWKWGSASDAQHIAAEFVGRFTVNRKSLNSISLNTDTCPFMHSK